MANQIRLKRIADQIREEFSALLVRQVADPRLDGITITEVKVDRELAFADIFVSSWQGHERSQEVIETLRHAAGFLRTELASKLDLRSMPRLRFHWDLTPEKADHIERLLLEIQHEREQREGTPTPPFESESEEEPSGEEDLSGEGEEDE